MQNISHAGEISQNITYKIYSTDADIIDLTRRILAFTLRNSTYAGSCDSLDNIEEITSQHYVIIVDPVCFSALNKLTEPCRNKLIIMPIPIGDVWSYWEIAKELLSQVKYSSDSINGHISVTGFCKFLSDYRSQDFQFDAKTMRLNRKQKLYLCDFPDIWKQQTNAIEAIIHSLSGIKSRNLARKLLFGDQLELWEYFCFNMFTRIQYMDYIQLKPGDVIINAGLHHGTEVPFFMNALQGQGQIHNIDPLGDGFLTGYSRKYIELNPGIVFQHDIALNDYNGEVDLYIGDEGDQAIGQMANTQDYDLKKQTFPCLTVDDFVRQEHLARIDLIKFDLEGAELAVVQRMLESVNKYRPQLAISIYHKVMDFLEIPLFLMKHLSKYQFYLEHYSFEHSETILYCIPNERNNSTTRNLFLGGTNSG